jgi:two-component system chemotaxis response regulator CheY
MSQTVLLVDDSAFIRTIIKVHLVQRKFCFLEAGTGEEALTLLDTAAPDLIIADMGMPGMDGVAFVRRVRSFEDPGVSELPIIVLTSDESDEHRREALEAGANDYLTKPVSSAGLVEAVGRLLPAPLP